MGSRSRKRRRPDGPGAGAAPPAAAPPPPEPAAEPDAMARGYARNRERDERLRASLEPLGPRERPPALVAAVVTAALLGLVNLVALLAGAEIDGNAPSVGGTIFFTALMLIAAWGMWGKRYWALLGFQALLALLVLVFSLFLLRAGDLLALAISVTVIGYAGWLFFKLVRVLARVQMPERRPGGRVY